MKGLRGIKQICETGNIGQHAGDEKVGYIWGGGLAVRPLYWDCILELVNIVAVITDVISMFLDVR